MLRRPRVAATLVLALGCCLAAQGAQAQPTAVFGPLPEIIRETRRDSTAAPAGAIGPRPARGLAWKDVPDDAGRAVDLTWELSRVIR